MRAMAAPHHESALSAVPDGVASTCDERPSVVIDESALILIAVPREACGTEATPTRPVTTHSSHHITSHDHQQGEEP